MRLLKLAAYALFGYALYEFVRGVMSGEADRMSASATGGGSSEAEPRQMSSAARQNITGPGRGTDVETADPDGAAMHHRVGRGVVR